MTILIPAYEPDERLLSLIEKIKEQSQYRIVVVDDGSGCKYHKIFEAAVQMGCKVLTHTKNMGKGNALKTGFGYIKAQGEKEGTVCADSDGQHLAFDIIKIAKAVEVHKSRIILGCRHFIGNVPIRSRFGNALTRWVYSFSTGVKIFDTQTGLRGFSADMLEWLCSIPGDRFEYEMNMLLDAKRNGFGFYEVEIDTVYLNDNKSSHFRPISDSVRVYLPILKFSASSLLAALLDFGLVMLINMFTSNLFLAVLGARIFSSAFNYTVNRVFVFGSKYHSSAKNSLLKYYTLASVILIMNYGLMHLLNISLGIPLVFSKLLTETGLYLFSFWSQRKFVFAEHKTTGTLPVRTRLFHGLLHRKKYGASTRE